MYLGGRKDVFASTCIHAWTTSSSTTMYVDAKHVERKQHLHFFTEAASTYKLSEILSVTYGPHLRPLVSAITLTMLVLLLKFLD